MESCRNNNKEREEFEGYSSPHKKKSSKKFCIFLNGMMSEM